MIFTKVSPFSGAKGHILHDSTCQTTDPFGLGVTVIHRASCSLAPEFNTLSDLVPTIN